MMPPYRFDTPPRCKQHVLNEKRTKCHWMLWSRYDRYFTRLEPGSSTELTGRTSKRESVPNVHLPLQGWQAVNMPLLSLSLNVMLLTGTVISLQSSCDMDLTYPISQRLRSRDTVLSKSADPSLLVHALLDLSRPPHIDWNWSHSNRHHIVVDKALQVRTWYFAQARNANSSEMYVFYAAFALYSNLQFLLFQCISCRVISFFINGRLNQLKRWSTLFDDMILTDLRLWSISLTPPTRM